MMAYFDRVLQAKEIVDSLANGINPFDGTPLKDNDIFNDVRLTRCLFLVSDILRQFCEDKNTSVSTRTKRVPFYISQSARKNFKFSDRPISASEIAKRLNLLKKREVCLTSHLKK